MRTFRRSLVSAALLAVASLRCLPLFAADKADAKETLFAADELVKTALRAELNLDSATRNSTLARAIAESPQHAAAHWQSGHVRVGDEWLEVSKSEERAASDPRLIEYRRLRQQAGDGLDGQIALARWCRKQNLDDFEQFHWWVVIRQTPQNKEAQTRLGLQEFRGEYLTRDQIEATKKQIEAVEEAVKVWKPRAQRWRTELSSRDESIRNKARKEIEGISELDAIPALEEFLAPASPAAELAVVGVLSRINEQIATDLLIRHAVLAEDPEVRQAAALALKPRSVFGYVPTLLSALKTPIEYSYLTDTFRTEAVDRIFELRPRIDTYVTQRIVIGKYAESQVRDTSASPVVRAQRAEAVNRLNLEADARNQRIYNVLFTATGQQLRGEPQAWWQWWQRHNELYASQESQKQVVSSQPRGQTRIYRTLQGSAQSSQVIPHRTTSCFLRGTKVWLDTGSVPIEQVRVGDRVLAQDERTGELTYRFVVGTTVRPPSNSLRIGLPNEEIATTLGHPIWVVGKGWRMAKEIEVGDHLHSMRGGVPVEFVEPGPESEAYNLVVAGFNTYFIGDQHILVHDNTARTASQAVLPGL